MRRVIALSAMIGFAAAAFAPPLVAAQLLVGVLQDTTPFALSGDSREEVTGGEIVLGERSFTITGTSRRGLIGASRVVRETADGPVAFGEYAVFSSSFSDQTVVGQPWAAAREYRACDSAYNSFLAVYRVDGEDAVKVLADPPYGALTENAGSADEAVVYCFISRPPPTP